MVLPLSDAQRRIEVLGHRITGFADEDRPAEYPTGVDLWNVTRGRDGSMHASSTAMIGGLIIVRVRPTSPTAVWAVQQYELYRQAELAGTEHREYDWYDSQPSLGWSVRAQGGVLQRAPAALEPRATVEIAWEFELIIPNYDGARTDAGPGAQHR